MNFVSKMTEKILILIFVQHCAITFFFFFLLKKVHFFCVALESARAFFSVTFLGFFKVAFGFVVILMQLQKIGVVFGATICFDGS